MALYRTALRLATLESLRPSAVLNTQGPWPTLAQHRVFDSRIDPIEDLTKDEHRAVIVIYTDDDLGYAGQHSGGPPFRREVDLVFEISQIARSGDGDAYEAGVPQTDGELEAELDRIESEIGLALFFHPVGKIWRDLTARMVTDPRSMVHRDSEEGARLAMRTLTWKVQVSDDLFAGAPVTHLHDIDRLPEPLRGVVKRLAHSAYARDLGLGLGMSMPTMPLAVPLKAVTLNAEIVKPGDKNTGVPNLAGDATLAGWPTAVVADTGGAFGS